MQRLKGGPKISLVFKRIVLAIDGSENSRRASEVAINLAKELNSDLIVLYALTSPSGVITSVNPPYIPEIDYASGYYKAALETATSIVGHTVEKAKELGVNVKGVVDRSIASTVEAIVNQAISAHADLIVLGTRGLGSFKKLVMGSVSRGVVAHADCSVLVVR